MSKPRSAVLQGTYRRLAGHRRTYTYTVSWRQNAWEAQVDIGGEIKGYPRGTFGGNSPSAEAVKKLVEAAIETRVQMVE